MDKYTVDLDKVLNDFEYSELTDQYGIGNASHFNNVNPSSSQRQQDPYKLRSTPVKHTINNVFQSLNEYLNTDIGVKSKQNQFSSTDYIKNVTLPGFSTQNLEVQPQNLDAETLSLDDLQTQRSLVPAQTLDDVPARELDDVPAQNVDDVPTQNLGVQPEDLDVLVQAQNLVAQISSIPNSNISVASQESAVNEENIARKELPDLKISQAEKINQEVPTSVPEILANDGLIKCNVKSDDTVIPQNAANQPDTCENIQIAISEANPVEILEENPDLIEPEVPSQVTEVIVGFNSFGIDDSELHHYLDELENEYESRMETSIEQPAVTATVQIMLPDATKTESLSEGGDIISETDSNVEDNNAMSRPSTLQINNATQIDLIGEPGSTPYNNVYISKTLPVAEVPTHESDTDTSPSASPTFSDVSTESNATTASTESITDSIDDKMAPKNAEPETAGRNLNEVLSEQNLENISNNNLAENAAQNATVSQINLNSDDASESVGQPPSEAEAVEVNNEGDAPTEQNTGPGNWLGKQAPLWIPDSEALNCLHCDIKFTVIKRRHHCRACGLVLCSKCCNMKYKLEYLDAEARVCLKCYDILNKDTNSSSGSEVSPASGNSPSRQLNQPNPNNPMEYCSMVPPLQQVSGVSQNPPTVMVPVGVLKRKGSAKSRTNKSVMFCDGIRPGSELTSLDNDFNYNESRSSNSKKGSSPPPPKVNRNAPAIDAVTKSFIPSAENSLPPTVTLFKSEISYTECANSASVVEMLKNKPLIFALQSNLHVHVKIINMDCCINKWAWCFSSDGMITVGQDEIVLLLEFVDNEKTVPKDIFLHMNNIYNEAKKGSSITENGISLHGTTNFLESKNHMGFLYIRPTFQCLQNVIVPKEPYLIGILIHRWEMPWAKIFPLRLVLRLGAEYRYYPSPIISTRHRESVFVEIGHTIINLLADFRNFSYTLPNIRGLTIHMEEKNTTVTIPLNRYDQVLKSLNNSSDHILAFGGNFSVNADSHLVCIQDIHGNNENTYTTHAINIHNRPRKVTGASFIVFNGALKSSSGLTAKSSIVEDGLMIQIPPEHMLQIREALRNMKSYTIQCGCINAASDETVNIVWGDNDVNFNMGVQSAIDNQSLGGIPSIRVHNGKDYVCNSGNRMIRWTEVFILQNGDDNARGQDVDFSKLAESISKATCQALVKYLDLLSSNNFYKIGIRTTLHVENVSYSAGSNGMKLPPIYMKSLDNELIPVLHRITSNNLGESAIVLELIFRILNV